MLLGCCLYYRLFDSLILCLILLLTLGLTFLLFKLENDSVAKVQLITK